MKSLIFSLLVTLSLFLFSGCSKSSPPLSIELVSVTIDTNGTASYHINLPEDIKNIVQIELVWKVLDGGDPFFNGSHGLGFSTAKLKDTVSDFNFNTGYTYEFSCRTLTFNNEFAESSKKITVTTSLDSNAFAIDRQGNLYPFKKFGNKTWFTRSLRTTTFNNGITIRKDPYTWMINQFDAHYDEENWNDDNNKHGLFYNYIVVGNTRNVCPVGWKIPSDADWLELESHFNMKNDDLSILDNFKSRGCDIQFSEFMADYSYRYGPTKRSGFNVFFQGERLSSRVERIGSSTSFYSSTKQGTDNGYIGRRFFSSNWPCGNVRYIIPGNNGSQIRCIKLD